jgi:SM-20-related protein
MELNEEHLQHFEEKGFLLLPDFLNSEETALVRLELEDLKSQKALVAAGIGRKEGYTVDTSQRGDFIHWIDPANLSPGTAVYFERMDALITALNRAFYLGIRDRECHYTEYPVGTFYKRHVDRHRASSSRIVSMVFYLNENWTEADGGELMIYQESGESKRVLPSAGLLAVFLSEKEHEVLPTQRVRQSITGWMLNDSRLL